MNLMEWIGKKMKTKTLELNLQKDAAIIEFIMDHYDEYCCTYYLGGVCIGGYIHHKKDKEVIVIDSISNRNRIKFYQDNGNYLVIHCDEVIIRYEEED